MCVLTASLAAQQVLGGLLIQDFGLKPSAVGKICN